MDFAVDPHSLASKDLEALREAVSGISDKFSVYYAFPPVRKSVIHLEDVFDQVGAHSDIEADSWLKSNRFFRERDAERGRIFPDSDALFSFSRLFGYISFFVSTNNPEKILPEVLVGHKAGVLSSIRGFNFGNVDQAYVSFKDGIAALNYEDQDLAHRLNFLFSPSDSLEMFSLKPSNSLTHSRKPRYDSSGDLLLYCDNPCCEKPVFNPTLVLESVTGSLYHNEICMRKDIPLKVFSGDCAVSGDLNFSRIPIGEARALYGAGKLQQSATTI